MIPKDIQEIFFQTLYGDRPVSDFEQWLYPNRQLEQIVSGADYLDLISFDYKSDQAAQGLYPLLEKHIHEGEYKLWKKQRQKQPRDNGIPRTPVLTPFDEQLERIKVKLAAARSADTDYEGFGAETHEYLLDEPATEEEISAFEHTYAKLPPCYRSFLLKVGNGGIGYDGAGAGPYFGIYPLGHGVNDLVRNDTEYYLKKNCLIEPDITTDRWITLQFTRRLDLFAGILPLGFQGCTYLHAIVLNGPYKGRVVNLDTDKCIPPIFSKQANFLDWYEKWLDEVIEGTHRDPYGPEFGY